MTKGISASDTIGCDVGDKHCELYILRADGSEGRLDQVKTTRAAMTKYFTRVPAHVVLENGTHSRWINALLVKLGHRVTVANARRVQLISQGTSKSDRIDAELLARLGNADLKLLSPITHRQDQGQAELAIAKARDVLVRARTKLINQARGLVKSFGERLPDCEAKAFHRRAPDEVPPILKPALDPLMTAITTLSEQIKVYDKTIDELGKGNDDVPLLTAIDGVGVLTAMVFLLTLEDKARFKKSRMVGAFLGLRPKRDQSGQIDKQLGITKAGDSFVRRLLVTSANHILGPFGKDSELRRWGLKLSERGGKSAKQRAKVAVARKLAVLMHRLWVTGEVYEPLGYQAKRAEAA